MARLVWVPLIVLSVACCVACGVSSPTQSAAPAIGKSAPSPPAAKFGDKVRLGAIDAEITSCRVGKADLETFGGASVSQDEVLIVKLKLTNHTKEKLVHFEGWNGGLFAKCSAKDEHGNTYRQIDFDIGTKLVGDEAGASIKPGESANAVVTFESPIKASQKITISLQGEPIGEAGKKFVWAIARTDWE